MSIPRARGDVPGRADSVDRNAGTFYSPQARSAIAQAAPERNNFIRFFGVTDPADPTLDLRGMTLALLKSIYRTQNSENHMRTSTTFLASLAFGVSISIGTLAAAGDVPSNPAKSDDIQPVIETTQRTSALRSLAAALSSGSAAMRPFHGSRSEDEENKDKLDPPSLAWSAILTVS